MESSEDDAGAATIASRRTSAREKDIGPIEDVNATSSSQKESSETRTTSENLAMSEDNFDGDSVPSPSTHDVNTSTEAILDMIDEIVDGPGAPKRLPLTIDPDDGVDTSESNEQSESVRSEVKIEFKENAPQSPIPQCTLPASITVTSAKSEDVISSECKDVQAESTSQNEATIEEHSDYANIPQPCSLKLDCNVAAESTEAKESAPVPSCSEVPHSSPPPNIPSSSVLQTIEPLDSENSVLSERTVKFVSSSDIRDNVTVESAESTSSDNSVSEGRTQCTETTRSPLRKRLVRPSPSDRRPDSTVSSTVDSQSIIINASEQISECVIKDVSSSSDAVPIVHCKVIPEEIRNVSEVSICQAETSTCPPKKIKLIRQKITPQLSHSLPTENINDIQNLSRISELCQSTSPESVSTEQCTDSTTCISTSNQDIKTVKCDVSSDSQPVHNEEPDSEIIHPLSEKGSTETDNSCVTNVETLPKQDILPSIPQKENIEDTKIEPHNELEESMPSSTETTKEIESQTSSTGDANIEMESECTKQVPKLTIKLGNKFSEEVKASVPKLTIKPIKPPSQENPEQLEEHKENIIEEITSQAPKLTSKPIRTSNEKDAEKLIEDKDNSSEEIKSQVPKVTIKPIRPPIQEMPEVVVESKDDITDNIKTPVPKLTIKPLKPPTQENTQNLVESKDILPEDWKSQVPKLTIKPIKAPTQEKPENIVEIKHNMTEEIKLNVPKLTIKPIRPLTQETPEKKIESVDQIPSVTKINIKPLPKRPEKITDCHRKSSSSEISESEYSENDESTSTSDQASASDGPQDVIPKVTIKLGKPGTESEGQFYTEKNVPKLTIKGIQNSENDEQTRRTESPSKLKVVISQSDERQAEKIPKLTIKNVKSEGQPLSPKLTIKPIKPPETIQKENITDECDVQHIPKLKISAEAFSSTTDVNTHVPKITIKPVTKPDSETAPKTPKKLAANDDIDHIPVVTKLNIKPIVKPTESGETSDTLDAKVPVVPKLNIKPIIKPKDSDVDCKDDVPKVTKLNIKRIKSPETNLSEQKDCDDLKAADDSIPVVTKLNIKPIAKPLAEEVHKDSENQSSETGNSSDENTDQIPVVTKLNIKPICRPNEKDESKAGSSLSEDNIPVVTKLNIKPLIKPDEDKKSPPSPKKENLKTDTKHSNLPVVTKINIKPVIKPDDCKSKVTEESGDMTIKNPPLLMKINMKAKADSNTNENIYSIEKSDNTTHYNNVNENIPTISKLNIKPIVKPSNMDTNKEVSINEVDNIANCSDASSSINCADKTDKNSISEQKKCAVVDLFPEGNCVPDLIHRNEASDCASPLPEQKTKDLKGITSIPKNDVFKDTTQKNIPKESLNTDNVNKITEHVNQNLKTDQSEIANLQKKQQSPSRQNCTLLKKLLEVRKEVDTVVDESKAKLANCSSPPHLRQETAVLLSKDASAKKEMVSEKLNSEMNHDKPDRTSDKTYDTCGSPVQFKGRSIQELCKDASENITKPLEINVSDKGTSQNSDQDSPRIILKINKTDHGSSAKIITEEIKKPETQTCGSETTYENDVMHQSRSILNSRRKTDAETNTPTMGKRLRSSRIVQSAEKIPIIRRNAGKRMSSTEPEQQNKETELSVLETKRLKLGQLLSNKALTITPIISKNPQLSPTKQVENKQGIKTTNHSLLNNENCSKNGNSKLHNILSNLQAKQIQTLPFNDIHCITKNPCLTAELESSTSTGSSDVISEIIPPEKSQPEIQQLIFHDNFESRDFNVTSDEISQDPLEVDTSKTATNDIIDIPKPVEMTPQPKKRGRPRKIPVSEGAKPVVTLPVPALEERPQRSLRLSRDRPVVLVKPRGGGRGRGRGKKSVTPAPATPEPVVETANAIFIDQQKVEEEIDPTSSRIKLPRMTEALDKMPSMCSTPLTSRRRNSSSSDMKFFGDNSEMKMVLEDATSKVEDSMKSPEGGESRGRGGRGGRGSRGGRGRTPAKTPRGGGRGRGRGGGRGAMYMKETMGIYGRVCGPATTTVQLFEEETCMMDDNATPAKPSHLLDEDSQSSVKSSTNESSKMRNKFADLFDSNKIWTAADVKEYTWPPPDKADVEPQVMMIQEQVAMFLNVKSFKRRYPELKRRTIVAEERDYVLSKGLVTEALCDLGITAVDASEVLDIMLSDYPHKYEEYRSHQRQRQLAEPVEEPVEEVKHEDTSEKTEVQVEPKPAEVKPEPPKVDPEKTRQDMALAAMASAAEWNALLNASRLRACADLQSLSVQRRRAPPPAPPPPVVRPPRGFYPHALLPGQYQHDYRTYTSQQLRYFPLNTALEAPPAPPSPAWSSDSEPEGSSRASSSDHEDDSHRPAKRKKLTKTKRSSQADAGPSTSNASSGIKEEGKEEVDTCRVCKLRLEANRKYTHERFLVCANCNAKLHPSCVDLSADTIRKCREYPWQCAECKTCYACSRPADDDKMLFCDLCDRGFHIYCVGLPSVPGGRWHCVECAICKSCGARSPGGAGGAGSAGGAGGEAAEWHHQTRRGPGGHKVYSHSLCTPCARAYRIGRYCPLCERSFIGPKGTMQLVICKLCDRQLHQECVRPTVAALNVLDYTCGECRRGGITSRAAAVRLAPRTIATLFMAKRRFNKYAHRQYLASRQRPPDASDAEQDAPDAADTPDMADTADTADMADTADTADTADMADTPLAPRDPFAD